MASSPDFPAVAAMAAIVAIPEHLTMGLIGISLIGLGVLKGKRTGVRSRSQKIPELLNSSDAAF